MHMLSIAVHAVTAVLAFGAGVTALVRPRWSPAFVALLAVSGLALAGVLVDPSPGMFAVDVALVVLFAVAVVRAEQARRVGVADDPRFVTGTGFGLVALADGFLVVLVLDLGAPVWAVVTVGVAVAVAGHLLLRQRLAEDARTRRVAGAHR